MSKSFDPQSDGAKKKRISKDVSGDLDRAIEEFLLAEDDSSGTPFDRNAWLNRYSHLRDELEQFLSDNDIASSSFGLPSFSDSGAVADEATSSRFLKSIDVDDLDATQVFEGGHVSTVADNPNLNDAIPNNDKTNASSSTDDRERRQHGTIDIGQSIGEFQLVSRLGTGGMGRVFEARDSQGSKVAIKLLNPKLLQSPESLERFQREGRIASRINHPRCVFVRAADRTSGQPYIVMELMTNRTLKDEVRNGEPLEPTTAVRKILDVVDGLAEAHEQGMVHRDVKPANCYLDHEGRVKIGDFGLAFSQEVSAELTTTGTFIGTPLYASPEQIRGEQIDTRSDVYSVCATLYYLLTGKPPFEGDHAPVVIARIVSDEPESPVSQQPTIPKRLSDIVMKGLSKRPADRWQSMTELRVALAPLVSTDRPVAILGLRGLAYVFDVSILQLLSLGLILLVSLGNGQALTGKPMVLVGYFSLAFFNIAYFVLFESWVGATIGKQLTGLNVLRIDGERGNVLRHIARVLLILALTGNGFDLFLWLVYGAGIHDGAAQFTFMRIGAYLIGLATILITLVFRPNSRLIHDWLTSTEVVRVAEFGQSTIFDCFETRRKSIDVQSNLPSRFGNFLVESQMRTIDRDTAVLVAQDTQLEREVLLFVRSENHGSLNDSRRRDVNQHHMRWLAGGQQDGFRWDAFAAPFGMTLAAFLDEGNRCDWAQVRTVISVALRDVVSENDAARSIDGASKSDSIDESDSVNVQSSLGFATVDLGLDRVWLDQRGRVVIEDNWGDYLGNQSKNESVEDATSDLSSEPRSEVSDLAKLGVLAQSAMTANGNSPVNQKFDGEMSLHQFECMQQLTAPVAGAKNQIEDELSKFVNRPANRNRSNTLAHVLLTTVGLISIYVFAVWVSRGVAYANHRAAMQRIYLTEVVTRVIESQDLHVQYDGLLPEQFESWSDPALSLRLKNVRDTSHQMIQEIESSISNLQSLFLTSASEQMVILSEKAKNVSNYDFSSTEEILLRYKFLAEDRTMTIDAQDIEGVFTEPSNYFMPLFVATLILVGINIGILVVWGFVFRGGFSLRAAGYRLANPKGKPASRFRCAWRAMLVFGSILIPVFLVQYLDSIGLQSSWSVQFAMLLVYCWPVALFLMAVTKIGRRLAGIATRSYVVPE